MMKKKIVISYALLNGPNMDLRLWLSYKQNTVSDIIFDIIMTYVHY